MQRIYFDYNASSPLAEPVIAAMSPFLREGFGNPSSLHWAGRPGRAAFEQARAQVAELLGCEPEEIFFTSGGTESNNFAIKGVFHRLRERGRHFVISAVEHPAVHRPIAFLERECGARVTVVPVDRTGRVSVDGVLEALTPETILVSIMHANNEVGTLQPVEEIGRACRERGVLFHTDAAQAVGKVAIDAPRLPCDLLSVAGHKLQAPKGVGALFVRKGVELEPFMHGAGHERGWRAGTENVLLAVGLGAAAELARTRLAHPAHDRIAALRDRLQRGLEATLPSGVTVNGDLGRRLPNTLSINFVGKVGQDVLAALEGVAASTGAACHSGAVELSGVLRAMGVPAEQGMGAIRFSLGWDSTEAEVDEVVRLVSEHIA
ncbi:MAG: cysteine desulfurase family protein [Candidatus Eisenbacteria bacterium]